VRIPKEKHDSAIRVRHLFASQSKMLVPAQDCHPCVACPREGMSSPRRRGRGAGAGIKSKIDTPLVFTFSLLIYAPFYLCNFATLQLLPLSTILPLIRQIYINRKHYSRQQNFFYAFKVSLNHLYFDI